MKLDLPFRPTFFLSGLAACSVLISACSKEPEAPKGEQTSTALLPKAASDDFITIDPTWHHSNGGVGGDVIKIAVYDGQCTPLGTLYCDGNSGQYDPVRYRASTLNQNTFEVYDGQGNTVAFSYGTHNWLVVTDDRGASYEVLSLDVEFYDPGSCSPCDTYRWYIAPGIIDQDLGSWYFSDNCNTTGPSLQTPVIMTGTLQTEAHRPFSPC